jgi:hypothetical protein
VALHLLWSEKGLQRELSQLPGKEEGRLWDPGTDGKSSLAAVCCANPPLFRQYVDLLFLYAQGRISRVGDIV